MENRVTPFDINPSSHLSEENGSTVGPAKFSLSSEPAGRLEPSQSELDRYRIGGSAAPSAERAPSPDPLKLKRRFSALKLFAVPIIAVAVLIFGGRAVYHMFTTESTDDAFVTSHVHTISSRINGTVVEVLVNDNDIVKKGMPLVRLDRRDFIVGLKIAQANYSKAHKDIARLGGTHEFLPDEKPVLDAYTANALTSEAELEHAQLQLEYTTITAPEDGQIGKRSVETGQQIAAGQALMALVERRPWIIANFKESQLVNIRAGQQAKITIDAIPDKVFEGTVENIAGASGATFSLLPPDNATGNFTKIVQRIPVKVVFKPESIRGYEDRIRSGMSTDITIDIR